MAYVQKEQPKEAQKEKDVGQIVRYLTHTFNQATAKMERPWRNQKTGEMNALYIMQTEFAYLLNEIAQSPRCLMQKAIAECNNFIDQAITEASSRS